MKYHLTIILAAVGFAVFAQTDKGAAPLSPSHALTLSPSVTRAVVIGISDYQDPAIPDLRFADRDAEAFANFLRSPAGGSLDGDHLKLLTNKDATTAQFDAALGWLMDESKEGDQAIIYFSGHGDVETKTRSQHGFLLCWDSPPQAYVSGAYPIFYLKDVVSTLSLENKARVIIITDACRSGKLAGNSIGGSQLTSQNLAQQFAGEIKILSCQPNEYSIEGEQWGGGRGAFSFHLLDGLYGMADGNADASVNLLEIGRYLDDHVTTEVAPQSQVPMTVGNRTEKLAAVFPDLLAQVKKNRAGQLPTFSPTDTRGIEDDVLATVDTTTRQLYRMFKQALKDKVFLEPMGACADAYYERLIAEPKMERLYKSMTRNYAAALQDDAQQAVNNLMKMEKTETQLYRTERVKKYSPYPRMLARAAELLGTEHYMYPTLQARRSFFEAWVFQLDSPINADSSLGRRILSKYRESLHWEPNAALTYLTMAEVFENVVPDLDSVSFYYKKAIAIAPHWIRPYTKLAWHLMTKGKSDAAQVLLDEAMFIDSTSARVWTTYGSWHFFTGNVDAAERYTRKAVALDSTWERGWFDLGAIYFDKGKLEESRQYMLRAAQAEKPNSNVFNYLGGSHYNAGEWEEAVPYFKKGLEIEPNDISCLVFLAGTYMKLKRPAEANELIQQAMAYDSSAGTLTAIAEILTDNGSYEESDALLLKCIGRDSLYFYGWSFLGYNRLKAGRYEQAIVSLNKALSINPIHPWIWSMLGQTYTKMHRFDDARQALSKMQELNPESPEVFANLAALAATEGKTAEALRFAETAFKKGMAHWQIYEYPYFDFAPVRMLPGFKDLEKKYFPGKVKD
jgi:protein O-mannosyl-transferase